MASSSQKDPRCEKGHHDFRPIGNEIPIGRGSDGSKEVTGYQQLGVCGRVNCTKGAKRNRTLSGQYRSWY